MHKAQHPTAATKRQSAKRLYRKWSTDRAPKWKASLRVSRRDGKGPGMEQKGKASNLGQATNRQGNLWTHLSIRLPLVGLENQVS